MEGGWCVCAWQAYRDVGDRGNAEIYFQKVPRGTAVVVMRVKAKGAFRAGRRPCGMPPQPQPQG